MNALALALAVALAMPATALRAPSTHFTFRFAPTDGASWIETERQTKMTETGAGLRRVIFQQSRTRVTAHRIPGGWRLDHKVLGVKLKRDGHDESDVMSGLVGLEMSLVTDLKGQLKRIEGLEKMTKAIGAGLPSLVGLALETFGDTGQIEASIREEWTDRIGYFAGMEAEVGQVWVGTGTMGSVHGPIQYHAATRVTDRMPYGGASCVRLRFVSHVNPNALGKISAEAAEKARAAAKPLEGSRDVEYASEGERILDPTTMMFRRERIFKTTKIWMDLPLVGRAAVTNEEQSETVWDYRDQR